MSFGHNNKATFRNTTYDVETEDRGEHHPFIDTTVYCRGKVVHRLTNSFYDLLPLSPENLETLRRRVDNQHRAVLEGVRSGALRLIPPPEALPTEEAAPPAQLAAKRQLQVELLNPRNWLAGNHAHLEVAVRDKATRTAIPGARITARIEGAAVPAEFFAQTGGDGRAMLAFPMPRLGDGDAALSLQAQQGTDQAQIRFQVRAKPKTPSPAGAA